MKEILKDKIQQVKKQLFHWKEILEKKELEKKKIDKLIKEIKTAHKEVYDYYNLAEENYEYCERNLKDLILEAWRKKYCSKTYEEGISIAETVKFTIKDQLATIKWCIENNHLEFLSVDEKALKTFVLKMSAEDQQILDHLFIAEKIPHVRITIEKVNI